MAADPTPASFEKVARRRPWISAPRKPPATPSARNAPSMMEPSAAGNCPMLPTITIREMPMYSAAIQGTSREVTAAIDGMPPTMIP